MHKKDHMVQEYYSISVLNSDTNTIDIVSSEYVAHRKTCMFCDQHSVAIRRSPCHHVACVMPGFSKAVIKVLN